jgi:hypothetical protein
MIRDVFGSRIINSRGSNRFFRRTRGASADNTHAVEREHNCNGGAIGLRGSPNGAYRLLPCGSAIATTTLR